MIHQMWAYKSEKQTHSRVYPNNISCLEVINEDLLMSKFSPTGTQVPER